MRRTRGRPSPGRVGRSRSRSGRRESVAVSFSSRSEGYSWSGVLNEPPATPSNVWRDVCGSSTDSGARSATTRVPPPEGSVLRVGGRAAEGDGVADLPPRRGGGWRDDHGLRWGVRRPRGRPGGLRDRVAAALVVLDPHVVRPSRQGSGRRVRRRGVVGPLSISREPSTQRRIPSSAVAEKSSSRPGRRSPRPASGEVVRRDTTAGAACAPGVVDRRLATADVGVPLSVRFEKYWARYWPVAHVCGGGPEPVQPTFATAPKPES